MKDRLGVLDGLRGIAVLLVLWYHVWELSWLPAPWYQYVEFIPETGFIGVHLFFFLSGFVITYPFVRALAKHQPVPTWGHFAWRRFIKIVPSYVLSIAVAYAIGYAAIERSGATPLQEIVSHLFFVHTWWQSTYGSINGVLWTLAVEVEFYCIFPLIWWCFRRSPYATSAAMVAVALVWRSWLQTCCYATIFPQWSENLPGYLDLFACGMLTAWLFVQYGHRIRESRWSAASPALAVAGTIGCIVLLQALYALRHVEQWQALGQVHTRALFGVAFACVAFGSLCAPKWCQLLLSNPPLRFLAIVSYNLYLYHQMIARELVTWHFPPYMGDPHFSHSWQYSYTLTAFALTIVEAAAVTYLFERPIMRIEPPGPLRRWMGHNPG